MNEHGVIKTVDPIKKFLLGAYPTGTAFPTLRGFSSQRRENRRSWLAERIPRKSNLQGNRSSSTVSNKSVNTTQHTSPRQQTSAHATAKSVSGSRVSKPTPVRVQHTSSRVAPSTAGTRTLWQRRPLPTSEHPNLSRLKAARVPRSRRLPNVEKRTHRDNVHRARAEGRPEPPAPRPPVSDSGTSQRVLL